MKCVDAEREIQHRARKGQGRGISPYQVGYARGSSAAQHAEREIEPVDWAAEGTEDAQPIAYVESTLRVHLANQVDERRANPLSRPGVVREALIVGRRDLVVVDVPFGAPGHATPRNRLVLGG